MGRVNERVGRYVIVQGSPLSGFQFFIVCFEKYSTHICGLIVYKINAILVRVFTCAMFVF